MNEIKEIPPIAIRNQRIQDAVALKKPDRVPFMPMLNNFYAMGYNISCYDAMKDIRLVKPAMEKLLEQYNPDLLWAPGFYPIDPLEITGATYLRWPGATHNLPLNTPFQTLDGTYLEDEEWDEYLKDPSAFLLQKVLPRKYKNLQGLSKLSIQSLCAPTPFCLAEAALPEIRKSLNLLLDAADSTAQYLGNASKIVMRAVELGYPVFGHAVMLCPFDEFADSIRGLITTIMDLKEDPEKLTDAVTRWGDVSIPRGIAHAKMMHAQYIAIPLHCGIDEFMSPSDYEKYYWPHLKRLMLAIIEAGITPVAICEGKYNSRLENLCDIPAGKVIYAFETVDIKRAKKILGKTACIAGNFPTQSLIYGTKEQVVYETKKLIDDCAGDGGYIMTNSLALDNANHDAMQAWYETTMTYGVYK